VAGLSIDDRMTIANMAIEKRRQERHF